MPPSETFSGICQSSKNSGETQCCSKQQLPAPCVSHFSTMLLFIQPNSKCFCLVIPLLKTPILPNIHVNLQYFPLLIFIINYFSTQDQSRIPDTIEIKVYLPYIFFFFFCLFIVVVETSGSVLSGIQMKVGLHLFPDFRAENFSILTLMYDINGRILFRNTSRVRNFLSIS